MNIVHFCKIVLVNNAWLMRKNDAGIDGVEKLTGTSLAKHEVVGAEELAEGAGTDRVHGSGLQVHQDSAGHVASA